MCWHMLPVYKVRAQIQLAAERNVMRAMRRCAYTMAGVRASGINGVHPRLRRNNNTGTIIFRDGIDGGPVFV
jgi:hypothetical protein